MFTNLLPSSDILFSVCYSDYAGNHYLKKFQKKYQGKRWELTDASIKQDLARLRMHNNNTQLSDQIDELNHKGEYWLAKYDFRVAGTNVSKKDSGNICILFINNKENKIDILMIYHKDDIPKSPKETEYILNAVKKHFDIWDLLV